MKQPWVLIILNGGLKLNIRVRITVQIINGINSANVGSKGERSRSLQASFLCNSWYKPKSLGVYKPSKDLSIFKGIKFRRNIIN